MAAVFTPQKRSEVMSRIRARDLRNETALRDLGWHVVTIWENASKTAAARNWLETRIPALLGGSK